MTHSMILCQEVAKRMKDPHYVRQIVETGIRQNRFPGNFWVENSFADGLPGIACFYSEMDHLFPGDDWDLISHHYLTEAISLFEKNGLNGDLSLFTGFAGLCFSVYICSHGGERYKKILSKLDSFFIDTIKRDLFFNLKQKIRLNVFFSPGDYNLCDGLSGILLYLTMRKDNDELIYLALDCVKILIDLLTLRLPFQNSQVPAWYISVENQLTPSEKEKYPEGSFLLGMPFGMSGVLASLSLALLSGFEVPNMKNSIRYIADWIIEAAYDKNGIKCWSNTLPFQLEQSGGNTQNAINKLSGELERDTWWYGIPAVCRALYLAGKAINQRDLIDISHSGFLGMFSKAKEDLNVMGTSFMHGRAGILSIIYRMAQDSKNPVFSNQIAKLEEDLQSFFRPGSAFGFQMVDVDGEGNYRWIDHPGIMSGAAGIALSLLLVQNRGTLFWDKVFAIN